MHSLIQAQLSIWKARTGHQFSEKNLKNAGDVGKVANIAEVIINGVNYGILWTDPFRVDITKALLQGKNELTIEVVNTWRNRLIRDENLPEDKRITHTNAPYRLNESPLLKAGLIDPVDIEIPQK